MSRAALLFSLFLALLFSVPLASTPAQAASQSSAKTSKKTTRKPTKKKPAPQKKSTTKKKTPSKQQPGASAPKGAEAPKGVPSGLIIPVEGVLPEQLQDSFKDARSGGRTHHAIDIKADHNTPVLASAPGKILKLHLSERGGITLYQLSADERFIYYYAHLDRYAEGIEEKKEVAQGEVLGYVGDTGNAGAGNYHLHFGIYRTTNPKRFWEGEPINPYPLLKKSQKTN